MGDEVLTHAILNAAPTIRRPDLVDFRDALFSPQMNTDKKTNPVLSMTICVNP